MEVMQALIVVLVALFGVGVGLKLLSWWKRQVALQGIDPGAIVRQRRGVSMRVLVQGTRALPGMTTNKANRTTGDLVLLADRFVLATGRGAVADLREGRGRLFTSVRCTGPGRLVIEGDVPNPSGNPGLFRVEVMLDDAREWADALKPWVREDAEKFASI